jgi:hypothetical protein
MPDYYIYKAPTCACGDDAVRIPGARRTEGLLQRAHWCTGTLQMTDGFGNPRYLTFIYPFFNAFIIDKAHAGTSTARDFSSSTSMLIVYEFGQ